MNSLTAWGIDALHVVTLIKCDAHLRVILGKNRQSTHSRRRNNIQCLPTDQLCHRALLTSTVVDCGLMRRMWVETGRARDTERSMDIDGAGW